MHLNYHFKISHFAALLDHSGWHSDQGSIFPGTHQDSRSRNKNIRAFRPAPSTELRGGTCCDSHVGWRYNICKKHTTRCWNAFYIAVSTSCDCTPWRINNSDCAVLRLAQGHHHFKISHFAALLDPSGWHSDQGSIFPGTHQDSRSRKNISELGALSRAPFMEIYNII